MERSKLSQPSFRLEKAAMQQQLFLPSDSAGAADSSVAVSADSAGWAYSGLTVFGLEDEPRVIATGDSEMAVLPLSGSCRVEVDRQTFDVQGRDSVFGGVAGFAYLPIDTEARITGPGEIALCTAKARRRIDPYVVSAADVPVEVRGGGSGTRQINNFLSADHFEADRLIAVEVITPESNWSSYPPHKHDEFSADEVELEEIYYFRIDGAAGTGFFSCYTPDGTINETVTVRDGDVFLVPRGFHGPAAATPGHHMYYLNVMAGPADDRSWKVCDDP
ncbi:MAG TPA: 5-deoxy-glucuronate isomerase, partial [Actinobacteria bacterium]|nr:5-deoxy-glucuronate isomerase [Actinomycetota bacterium]